MNVTFPRARAELKRLRWLIAIVILTVGALDVVGIFHELSKYALVAYALCKGAMACIGWHLVRSEIFYYVDVESAYRGDSLSKAVLASAVLLSTALLFLGVVLAV